ncbi:MAG TPA: hypothetical protein VNV85_01095 [Puia sp.]|jgi:hypothetical protein|nr:hypothetical protein [Puia sp.]
MKRLLPTMLIIAASLFASAAYSQVYVHARINLPVPFLPPLPHVHIYDQPTPEVVYENSSLPSARYYPEFPRETVVYPERRYEYGHAYYDRDDRYQRGRDKDREYHDYREHRGYEREHRR